MKLAILALGTVVAIGGAAAAFRTAEPALAQAATAPRTAPAVASGADAAHPAVIELYQSQGCSSCPPALVVLDKEADRPDVLALNFAVTYWDQLGWKDRFAEPEYTARQWEYSRAQGRSEVATPQLIINGRAAVLGSDKASVDRAIAANAREVGPEIVVKNGVVELTSARLDKPVRVWLVGYDPRRIDVPIGAGENGGRTLPHRNIVRQLQPLASYSGGRQAVTLPRSAPGLARAILLQQGTGGPIRAAARI